jgi:hypothetical protein
MGQEIFKVGSALDIKLMAICSCLVVVITLAFETVLHHLEYWIKVST